MSARTPLSVLKVPVPSRRVPFHTTDAFRSMMSALSGRETAARPARRNYGISPARRWESASSAEYRLRRRPLLRSAAGDPGGLSTIVPKRPINLFDMSCGDQFQALEEGRIDLGFVGLRGPIEERGLQFLPIASYKTVAAVSKNHPLAKESAIELKKLKSIFFIGMSEASYPGYRDWLTENLPKGRLRAESPPGCGNRTRSHLGGRGGLGRRDPARAGEKAAA